MFPQIILRDADLAAVRSDLAGKESDLEAARSDLAVKDAELAAVRDQLGRHIERERELELDLALSLQVWMCASPCAGVNMHVLFITLLMAASVWSVKCGVRMVVADVHCPSTHCLMNLASPWLCSSEI